MKCLYFFVKLFFVGLQNCGLQEEILEVYKKFGLKSRPNSDSRKFCKRRLLSAETPPICEWDTARENHLKAVAFLHLMISAKDVSVVQYLNPNVVATCD